MQPNFIHCLKYLFASAVAATATCVWSAGSVEVPSVPWPTSGWQVSTPEQQGMHSDAVRRLVEFGARNAMDSLLVVRHGRLVVDAYYAPYRADLKHHFYSATKGVVATLTGIAVKDGFLKGVTQPVVEFFPEYLPASTEGNKKIITIQHLLDMTSGIDWNEPLDGAPESLRQMRRSLDWNAFVLDQPMVRSPGSTFNYNSGNYQLLSTILSKAAGKSAAEFAQERLFGPLGITQVLWRKDPQGNSIGGFGLYMQPRDMAKIAYLYLHNGQWDGQQLLPPRWTDKVFHATLDMRMGSTLSFTYANGWWTIPQRDVYMAVGFLQQLVMVLPKLDMVVVVTGKKPPRFAPLLDLLEASASSQQALPANPMAQAELAKRVRAAAIEKAADVVTPASTTSVVSTHPYQFEPNAIGLRTLKLDLAGLNPSYEMLFGSTSSTVGTLRISGPVGLNGRFHADADTAGPILAVKASWLDASTLSMVSQWVTDGVVATYTLRFSGNKVAIEYKDNSGVSAQLHGASNP